ncbi:MAG: hypothetical protein RAP70_03180 [Candidatus Celaenobacter antarcticus]|nr:hypothetical protein [Candidatus Celaenobacter antarcticus]
MKKDLSRRNEMKMDVEYLRKIGVLCYKSASTFLDNSSTSYQKVSCN